MELTPRERLASILELECVALLKSHGFKFAPSSSQFTRKVNSIKQIVRFQGGKWNYADVNADYELSCYCTASEYPKWYLQHYNTDQSNHHQCKVNEHLPQLTLSYLHNWNSETQVHRRYDLINFPTEQISNSIVTNITENMLPYLNQISTYTGIGSVAAHPLDSFDFFMMDNNVELAEKKLQETIRRISEIKDEVLNSTDEFKKNSIANTIQMINKRIEVFFPENLTFAKT